VLAWRYVSSLIDLPGEIDCTHGDGCASRKHYHTGDVFVNVVEGEFVVDVEGKGCKRFGPGEVYHEAVNTVTQARNPSTEVATKAILFQIGEKGTPLMILAEQ